MQLTLGDPGAFLLKIISVGFFTWPYRGVEECIANVELDVDLDRDSESDRGHASMPRVKTNFPRQRGK